MFARVTPFLLFAAFLLLLLVTLSAPIIDVIYLFRLGVDTSSLPGSDATARVHFGVFGYCIARVQGSVIGVEVNRDARCSKPRLGYTMDSTVARVLRADDISDLVSRGLTAAFVLNPIATGLTFIAFLMSLLMLRRSVAYGRHGSTVKTTSVSRIASFLTFGLGLLAALAATAAFVINIVIVAIVRNRLRVSSDGLNFYWGNGIWMTLGAVVALWIAVIGAMWGVCCGGRSRKTANGVY